MESRPAGGSGGATGYPDWRPQRFGRDSIRKVQDPLIEPYWPGDRVLVRVGFHLRADAGSRPAGGLPVAIEDIDGVAIEGLPEIEDEIRAAAWAATLIVDGYLTTQATRPSSGIMLAGPAAPTPSELASQLLLGSAGRRDRHRRPPRERPADAGKRPFAFVAVDLLLVDGQSIVDVPLLERKRLLEGVLGESELVRRTPFVRPPVDPWLATWRSAGFGELAYKAANGRYRPGDRNPGWATTWIPAR